MQVDHVNLFLARLIKGDLRPLVLVAKGDALYQKLISANDHTLQMALFSTIRAVDDSSLRAKARTRSHIVTLRNSRSTTVGIVQILEILSYVNDVRRLWPSWSRE